MEAKYALIKRRGRIYLVYIHDGKSYPYASVHERYGDFVRLVARGDEMYDIMTVMRVFILMKVLPRVRDVIRAVDVIRDMRDFETLFWYVKISKTQSAVKAFKTLYGLR